MSQSPYELLHAIANSSLKTAPALPAQLDIKPHWSGIGFKLAGYNFVAPLDQVAEILAVPATTKLPGVQSWVLGISNIRGKLLPLIDLDDFFGISSRKPLKSKRVMVLEVGELYTGLVVDEVTGMQHFPVDAFSESVADELTQVDGFFDGSYKIDEQVWSVFMPYRLAKNTAFMNAAI